MVISLLFDTTSIVFTIPTEFVPNTPLILQGQIIAAKYTTLYYWKKNRQFWPPKYSYS